MKGQTILVFVIVTIALVRSQGPTRTKSGPPPPSRRRNDNPDIGLPSGADVPDGQRLPPGGAVPPPAPTKTKSGPPPARGAPPANVVPPAAGVPQAGPPPAAGRRGDNPDWGLPSGKDVPDGQRFMGPPPAAGIPPVGPPPVAAAPRVAGRRGDNPDWGLPSGKDVPDGQRFMTKTRSGPPPRRPSPPVPAPFAAPVPFAPPMNVVRPAPPPAAVPQNNAFPAYNVPSNNFFNWFTPSCESQCPYNWQPVCSVFGNTYDNDCRLKCSGETLDCNGQCPCDGAGPEPIVNVPVNSCGQCAWEDFNPVCTEDEKQYPNECTALCEGATILCSSHCPC